MRNALVKYKHAVFIFATLIKLIPHYGNM